MPEQSPETLHSLVDEAVRRTSLRKVGGEAGLAHTTVQDYLAHPGNASARTLDKLQVWAAGKGRGARAAADATTVWDYVLDVTRHLNGIAPAGEKAEAKLDVLELIRRGLELQHGSAPEWWYVLRDKVESGAI